MKKMRLFLSVGLTAVMLLVVSLVPFHAVTLYTDGVYTFADIDEDYVALYAYDESTPNLVIPENYLNRYVSAVYDYAFEDNTTITSVDFSECSKLNTIGIKSFASCKNLFGTLTLPNSIRKIGLGAFERCTSLSEVVINSSVKTIPQQCFNRCSSLLTVYLSPSVERIDNLAFANCDSLRDVYFSTTVNSISDTAFSNSRFIHFHVWYGSYAYNFARANNIQYTLLDDKNLGDANGDGAVNINDVTAIQRYKADMETLEGINFHAADVNCDSNVTIEDATVLQRYFAEFDDISYPIGEVITQ